MNPLDARRSIGCDTAPSGARRPWQHAHDNEPLVCIIGSLGFAQVDGVLYVRLLTPGRKQARR